MKLSLALALLLPTLPGLANDSTTAMNQEPGAVATTEKAHPELLHLEAALMRKQDDKKAGRVKPEEYQEWAGAFRTRLDATMARVPPSPDNTAAHARIAALLGEREQARVTLDQALERNPGSSVLIRTKGQILYEQNDFPGATRYGQLAWDKSGHTDYAALALYHTSKDRVAASGASPEPATASVAHPDVYIAGPHAPSKVSEDAPRKHLIKNVRMNLPSPLAPVDVDPLSRDDSAAAIVKTVFFAAAAAAGGLLLFLGFGAKQLEERFPNIRRNTGIALGVSGVLAAAAVSWPATQATITAQAPPLIEAGRRLKDRFAGSFTQIADSETGAINPASERVLQATPTLNNLNLRLAAQEIAGGHAYAKHAAELGAKSPAEFATRIESIMANPTMMRTLSNGRIAYWHQASATVVIRDPSALDGGTAFMARDGANYFLKLR